MRPPESLTDRIARHTPDGRRARVALAAGCLVVAAGSLYATARMASSQLSGTEWTLLRWGLGVLALAAAAAAPVPLVAEEASTRPAEDSDPLAVAKRRYAAGELSEAAFERRVETLLAADERVETEREDHSAVETPARERADEGATARGSASARE